MLYWYVVLVCYVGMLGLGTVPFCHMLVVFLIAGGVWNAFVFEIDFCFYSFLFVLGGSKVRKGLLSQLRRIINHLCEGLLVLQFSGWNLVISMCPIDLIACLRVLTNRKMTNYLGPAPISPLFCSIFWKNLLLIIMSCLHLVFALIS